MAKDMNSQEEILNFALNILIRTIASKKIDLEQLRQECNNAIFQEQEAKLSSDAKLETIRILERQFLSYPNNKQLENLALPTGSHHNYDGVEIIRNEGTGLNIKTDDPNANLTLRNIRITDNKGYGIHFSGGKPTKTNVELILDAVKDKLPNEIKLEELTPLIKDVLDSKSPDEAKRKIDTSTLSNKFKEPALWISFGNLLIQLVRPLLS